MTDRSELATRYLEQLPYPPYPVQEEALLTWFTTDRSGVLICAPTGTGKTLIAEAALYEALHSGRVVYYTTPLIALTEQKFHEFRAAAERWGFSPDDVGLVTGHRKVNPRAKVLVVVAEILLNRLLQPDGFEFDKVAAVVMDEFHSFADPERGIVWELSLAMLPAHVRLMLLSATVGNATEFLAWLHRCHGRELELVEGRERKVPLVHTWVPDQLLGEFIVEISKGGEVNRRTPALVFCFNRDECWSVAEHLKGLDLLPGIDKSRLHNQVNALDWTQGVGPKLKQMLHRGVGVHHAGLLPKYRRVVEHLFQQKLLSIVVCTETLAAGINLPARSVVFTCLVKGPKGDQKLIDASTAHQIMGRAGRPQFDDRGYVYALAHEDDVKILRWQQKYDQIPDTTKDPILLKKKKELKRKKPSRREAVTYWTEGQFEKLKLAPPGKLYSKGPLPWRLLAYLLTVSPEVERVRRVIRKRLMDDPRIDSQVKTLGRMLSALHRGGFVTTDPAPPDDPAEPLPEFITATPTPRLAQLMAFRSIHPVYGVFLLEMLGPAGRIERLQALESVLEIPKPMLRYLRVPWPEDLPPGPLETETLDTELLKRGLIAAPPPPPEDDDDEVEFIPWEERPPRLAEKLLLYFDALHPDVGDVTVQPVWCASELLKDFNGEFNLYVKTKDLTKQEGIVFRHLLRLILLCNEFLTLEPPAGDVEFWKMDLRDVSERLTESCRAVDPQSTDEMIARAAEGDVAG